jgi:hypothetical protein
MACVLDIASAWEEISISMERYCHDSICAVEGFLDSISMMHVDVNIEYSVMVFQELQDSEDYIIDIAEATCLHLFGMMEASRPINADVRALVVEFDGCI